MVRIEEHNHGLAGLDVTAHTSDDLRIDRAALENLDEPAQRMPIERGPIVWPNVDVHANHTAAIERLAQRRVIDQRATVRHAGLDDHVRTHAMNHLLQPNHIVGQLNDWPPEPAE